MTKITHEFRYTSDMVCEDCGSDLQEDQCNVAATDSVDSCPECEGTNLNTDATKCWNCSGQN